MGKAPGHLIRTLSPIAAAGLASLPGEPSFERGGKIGVGFLPVGDGERVHRRRPPVRLGAAIDERRVLLEVGHSLAAPRRRCAERSACRG